MTTGWRIMQKQSLTDESNGKLVKLVDNNENFIVAAKI
jgi:hypothetical protein